MKMRFLLSNWINLIGVLIAVLLFFVIRDIFSLNFVGSIIVSLFIICYYGFFFWKLFLFMLILLDIILILPNPKHLRTMLFIEWIIICIIFGYLVLKQKVMIYLYFTVILAFLITQCLRLKYLATLLKQITLKE